MKDINKMRLAGMKFKGHVSKSQRELILKDIEYKDYSSAISRINEIAAKIHKSVPDELLVNNYDEDFRMNLYAFMASMIPSEQD